MDDPYHEGSRAVQDRLGLRAVADHIGRSIGPGLREVAAAFLGLQPMLVISAADEAGRMWSSLLTGTATTVFGAAGRTLHFTVAETVETPHASPLRWSTPAYSPANPPVRDSA